MEFERVNLGTVQAPAGKAEGHIRSLIEQHQGAILKKLTVDFKGQISGIKPPLEISSDTSCLHKFGASVYANPALGKISLEVEPKALTRFTDQFFHSEDLRKGTAARLLTASDLRFQSKLTKAIASTLLESDLLADEVSILNQKDLAASVCANIILTSSFGEINIRIRFHSDYLQNALSESGETNGELSSHIATAIPSVPVAINVQLWSQSIALNKLMAIEEGSELPIFLSDKSAIRIADVPIFKGVLVEQANQLIFEIHEPYTER
ncbi:FliM/FliN family flagellar motor switch protein [uncultured Umboniibacter sp.]|uniref:FliM/FliN family flagellar motor switch protein n=1 Tax=uncultured Umboniibacter sp. TaxID=1798917 RepID=UPI0026109E7D|nr:FliM/FliN family flagellar motor switch protein [uncultured Umboniibacter sp.]